MVEEMSNREDSVIDPNVEIKSSYIRALRGLHEQFKAGKISENDFFETAEESLEVVLEKVGKDSLTNLVQRRIFEAEAVKKIAEARRTHGNLLLIAGDLDYLKYVNDTYGHLAGDQMLIAISQAINNRKRIYDLGCRWGGDEFVVLCGNLEENAIPAVTSGFQEAIDSRLKETGREIGFLPEEVEKISFSMGYHFLTGEELLRLPRELSVSQMSELLKIAISEADKLMYQRKKEKKTDRTSEKLF